MPKAKNERAASEIQQAKDEQAPWDTTPETLDELIGALKAYRDFLLYRRPELLRHTTVARAVLADEPHTEEQADRVRRLYAHADRLGFIGRVPADRAMTAREAAAHVQELYLAALRLKGKETGGQQADPASLDEAAAIDLVSLDEAAAIVHRTKRTLERHLSKMPAPQVQGGGGKPSLWNWTKLRPWLESEYVPDLPKGFPRNVR